MERFYLYIVLTRTNTVMSKLIQIFKNYEYTHAAISLDKGLNQMYSFGRRKNSDLCCFITRNKCWRKK